MISSRTLLLLVTVFTSSVLTAAFQSVSPSMRTLCVKPASPTKFTMSSRRQHRPQVVYSSFSAVPPEQNEVENPLEVEEGVEMESTRELTLLDRIKQGFRPKDDGLSFRQRLGKMGLAALLSYGWVSNMSYSVTVSLAWYISSRKVRQTDRNEFACKVCTVVDSQFALFIFAPFLTFPLRARMFRQTGLSPLAPGQWKPFLAVYAGFFVFNNIIRPVRLAVAVVVSPYFDRFINGIQNRLQVSRGIAIASTVILVNLFGTIAFMSAGILLAGAAAGVPVFAPKLLV
jgi:hypothetical protein